MKMKLIAIAVHLACRQIGREWDIKKRWAERWPGHPDNKVVHGTID